MVIDPCKTNVGGANIPPMRLPSFRRSARIAGMILAAVEFSQEEGRKDYVASTWKEGGRILPTVINMGRGFGHSSGIAMFIEHLCPKDLLKDVVIAVGPQFARSALLADLNRAGVKTEGLFLRNDNSYKLAISSAEIIIVDNPTWVLKEMLAYILESRKTVIFVGETGP